MPKRYQIACNVYFDPFREEVESLLSLGWVLYGPPFMNEGTMCQAMTHDQPRRKGENGEEDEFEL